MLITVNQLAGKKREANGRTKYSSQQKILFFAYHTTCKNCDYFSLIWFDSQYNFQLTHGITYQLQLLWNSWKIRSTAKEEKCCHFWLHKKETRGGWVPFSIVFLSWHTWFFYLLNPSEGKVEDSDQSERNRGRRNIFSLFKYSFCWMHWTGEIDQKNPGLFFSFLFIFRVSQLHVITSQQYVPWLHSWSTSTSCAELCTKI